MKKVVQSFYCDAVPAEEKDDIVNDAWVYIRKVRDDLIQVTDFTQMSDFSITEEKRLEFAAYRQALRDLPQNFSNPNDVVWPEKPTL
ncbi:tail fiber assembly protein [Vibrio sp. OPT20]|uniref:tail fiber assembly protein n=1 Tax=Vibrio sp. OPT20 TaxID=2778642 RepID=UPI001D14362A|nr:tail fiber assembly protein [Vibrio sp. OPT20]